MTVYIVPPVNVIKQFSPPPPPPQSKRAKRLTTRRGVRQRLRQGGKQSKRKLNHIGWWTPPTSTIWDSRSTKLVVLLLYT